MSSSRQCNVKAEYFDANSETWANITDIPIGVKCIYGYATVYSAAGFYIVGGLVQVDAVTGGNILNILDRIYRLDSNNWKWSEAGQLNSARYNHGAMVFHNRCRNTVSISNKATPKGLRANKAMLYLGRFRTRNFTNSVKISAICRTKLSKNILTAQMSPNMSPNTSVFHKGMVQFQIKNSDF